MKYRKKPVVIEAEQLTAENWGNVLCLLGAEPVENGWKVTPNMPMGNVHYNHGGVESVEIITLEGTMLASYGDYIIKGTHGEYYPCKAHIFEQNYEQVEEQQ